MCPNHNSSHHPTDDTTTATTTRDEDDFVLVDHGPHSPNDDHMATTIPPPLLPLLDSMMDTTMTELDEAFAAANDDGDDDDDVFLPAQQQHSDDDDDDDHQQQRRHCCVSPVPLSPVDHPVEMEENDNSEDRTDRYVTPMSSPLHCSTGSAVEDDHHHHHTLTKNSTALIPWTPLATMSDNGNEYYHHNNNYNNNFNNFGTTMNVPSSYRGLVNLGNTCYMASALQMLGSIPFLIHRLVPPEIIPSTTTTTTCVDTKLRLAFLQIMEQIQWRDDEHHHHHPSHDDDHHHHCVDPGRQQQNNSAISPYAFKQALDERTGLFVGFRQHDAHEFTTTLLDLLDANYKQHQPPVPPICTTEPMDVVVVVDHNFKDEEEEVVEEDQDVKFRAEHTAENDGGGGSNIEMMLNPLEDDEALHLETNGGTNSCNRSKKQKMDESLPSLLISSDTADAMSCSATFTNEENDNITNNNNSYSNLDVEAIERLIHGPISNHPTPTTLSCTAITTTTHNESGPSPSQQQQPYPVRSPCKLVGGRMNTNDIILTPYSNNNEERNEEPTSPLLRHSSSLFHSVPQPTNRHGRNSDTMLGSENDTDGEPKQNDDGMNHQDTTVVVSPIDTTFTTEVRVRLTCDSCKLTRTHKETYLHLSLEIGASSSATCNDDDDDDMCSTNHHSIKEGLRRFFAPCTQQLKCDQCFGGTATQVMEITALPPVLLLHLKRFIVDCSPDWSSLSYRKNQSAVELNEEILVNVRNNDDDNDDDRGVLTEFLASDCRRTTTTSKYTLRSVVNHIGASANCGHYTADAQRGEQKEWFRFNDTHVSSVSATEVMEQSKQTAYMCLYELV